MTPSTAIDTALLARVKALGPYDPHGPDEDYDRAASNPCCVTTVDLGDASITIYGSSLNGMEYGYVEQINGPRTALNTATMEAIIDAVDVGGFPIYPE